MRHEVIVLLVLRLRHIQVLVLLLLNWLLIVEVLRVLNELLVHHSWLRGEVSSKRGRGCHRHPLER